MNTTLTITPAPSDVVDERLVLSFSVSPVVCTPAEPTSCIAALDEAPSLLTLRDNSFELMELAPSNQFLSPADTEYSVVIVNIEYTETAPDAG